MVLNLNAGMLTKHIKSWIDMYAFSADSFMIRKTVTR